MSGRIGWIVAASLAVALGYFIIRDRGLGAGNQAQSLIRYQELKEQQKSLNGLCSTLRETMRLEMDAIKTSDDPKRIAEAQADLTKTQDEYLKWQKALSEVNEEIARLSRE